MKKKHKITLLVIGILLALSLMLSSSYALWVFNVSQESTNAVQADCFEITYNDSNPIHLEYSFPIKDSDGVKTTPYEFTIHNICNHPADLQINLETLNTSTLDASNIKIDLNGHISLYNNLDSVEPILSNASEAAKLNEYTIVPNEEKTYNLRLWIKEDAIQNEIENKTFLSKLSVKSTVRNKFDVALLMKGYDFVYNIRTLSGEVFENEEQLNTTIKHIRMSNNAPSESNNAILVSEQLLKPVYAWFDSDTIYLYSEANKIFLYPDSNYLFYGLSALEDIDLSRFDTSRVTSMIAMFGQLSNLTSLDVSNFDTSKVTNMANMFENCKSLTELNVSNFNTSNVTNMGGMFAGLESLQELDLSHLDTRKVTDMSYMFDRDESLTSLDLRNFDTSIVTDMIGMFFNMHNLKTLYLGKNFNTSNVTNGEKMFQSMEKLETIYSNDLDYSKCINCQYIFWSNVKLQGGQGTRFEYSKTDGTYARVDDPANGRPGYFTSLE